MIVTKQLLVEREIFKIDGNGNFVISKAQKRMIKKRLRKCYVVSKKRTSIIGFEVSESFLVSLKRRHEDIEQAAARQRKEAKRSQILNSVSVKDGWSWKPDNFDIPKIKRKRKNGGDKGSNRAKRIKLSKKVNDEFYSSREWRSLRLRVLEKYECKCMMCGRSPKDHGIVIHVDHIKPRSKYPELSLVFENLQLLCEDCNLGKSNKYETDWRPNKGL